MRVATTLTASNTILFNHLPAVYQKEAGPLAPFLAACEAILLGAEDPANVESRGLGATISRLHTLLDPDKTPEPFLQWLAGWLALELRADLDESTKRELLTHIVSLYSWRGTRKGLETLLALLTGATPVITEPETSTLEVGAAVVGSSTRLGSRPFYFSVRLELPPSTDQQAHKRIEEIAREVIEREKPAHTYYSLEIAASVEEGLADGH